MTRLTTGLIVGAAVMVCTTACGEQRLPQHGGVKGGWAACALQRSRSAAADAVQVASIEITCAGSFKRNSHCCKWPLHVGALLQGKPRRAYYFHISIVQGAKAPQERGFSILEFATSSGACDVADKKIVRAAAHVN